MSQLSMTQMHAFSNLTMPKLMVNPLIVLNMGTEMIYILQQRLKAQKIAKDKAYRVLLDTVSALFDTKSIDSMFTPKTTYESSFVRALFHEITHSSIMRLNDQSMDKLYDLMLMGLKVQLVRSRDCYELIESTIHRIDNIYSIILNNQDVENQDSVNTNEHNADLDSVLSMIQSVRDRIIRSYSTHISSSKLLVIRKRLFQWLQDRRIKVSILLQKQLQCLDGHIVTHSRGMLPKNTQIPGKQYRITLKTVNNKPNDLILPNSKCCFPNNLKYSFVFNRLHTKIGENLYQSKSSKNNKMNEQLPISPNRQNTAERKMISNAVKNQLNDLAAIINEPKESLRGSRKKKRADEVITLDLFDLDKNGEKGKNKLLKRQSSVRFGRSSSALQDALDNLDLGDNESSTDIKTSADNSNEEDLFDLLNNELF